MSAALVGLALGLSALTISPVRAEVTGTDATAAELTTQQAEELLKSMQTDIEKLIVDKASDADALKKAVEDYVTAASDPETAAKAVIAALTGPGAAAKNELDNNPALAKSVAQGLGAAIATIALTDPDAAAAMQASVDEADNEDIAEAVTQGSDDKTASIKKQQEQQRQQQDQQQGNQTAEKNVSPH